MRINELSLQDVEFLAFSLAREKLPFDEPIPDFATRYPHRLESCILTPFQTFGGKSLYPTLVGKAAILFYLMIKNHPFKNGNKRIAITTLMTFLDLNDKWLKVSTQELYNVTVWVASSPPQFKPQVVEAIERFVASHLVKSETEEP
jgi:death-on-curing family protein